jgi:hypothetical protein
MELNAAQEVFERLGAVATCAGQPTCSRRSEATERPRPGAATSGPVRTARTFVFTDIVDLTRLNEHWATRRGVADPVARQDDPVAGRRARRRGDQGDRGRFFLAFPETDDAIETAIAIQRRFDEQRRSQSFAPRCGSGSIGQRRTGPGSTTAAAASTSAARVDRAATGARSSSAARR